MALTFTNIQHSFRKENDLSLNEYVLCDMVFYLSNNDGSPVPGWCFMSRQNLANELGLSKQAIISMIDRMIERGFLYKNEVSKDLKTSAKWQAVYFTDGKETLPIGGKETLPEIGKETLPYNNKSYNNKSDNDTIRHKKIEFCKKLLDWVKANNGKYPKLLLVEFAKYWTEPSKSGKKIRFDNESFFDFSKRLSTWFKNSKDVEVAKYWEVENSTPLLNDLLKGIL